MYIEEESLKRRENFKISVYKGEVMRDGKIFSPSIHRRYLPTQYLSMLQGGYLLPASPLKFTWAIRRWLGLEISNIIRMKNTPSLGNEYKIRIALLGENIFKYLIDKERRKENLKYGRGLGRRDAIEWVYLVPEEWILENMVELYNSYMAMGCYYTITSLQAYGKLHGTLEGVTKGGTSLELALSDSGDSDDAFISEFSKALRKDKVFRESLSFSCLNKLNLSKSSSMLMGRYLKNEEGAIKRFMKFYEKEYNTRKVTDEVYAKYNIPVVDFGLRSPTGVSKLYVK